MQPPVLYLWVSGFPLWHGFCSNFCSGQPCLPMIHCLPLQFWGASLVSPPAYVFKDCSFYNLFSVCPCFGSWKSVHLLSISNRYWLTPIYLVYILLLSFQLLWHSPGGLISTFDCIHFSHMCLQASYSLFYELPLYIFP